MHRYLGEDKYPNIRYFIGDYTIATVSTGPSTGWTSSFMRPTETGPGRRVQSDRGCKDECAWSGERDRCSDRSRGHASDCVEHGQGSRADQSRRRYGTLLGQVVRRRQQLLVTASGTLQRSALRQCGWEPWKRRPIPSQETIVGEASDYRPANDTLLDHPRPVSRVRPLVSGPDERRRDIRTENSEHVADGSRARDWSQLRDGDHRQASRGKGPRADGWEDDAQDTFEYDDYYAILPTVRSGDRDHYVEKNGGRAYPEGFRYSSETNTQRLSVVELQQMIGIEKLSAE
jgi:hypothetical protein